jgi:tRNA modification GTPase
MAESDTITAIATAPGESALAIVRLSGTNAIPVADAVFQGRTRLSVAAGFTVHYGHVVNRSGEAVDEVLAVLFRAPHSYTGEDLVEFSCHGGGISAASVLDALLAAGARNAQPGEFTRRAFMNGRIDLSQAEAVADLIAARSRRAQRASLDQLSGRLGSRVGELRKEIVDLCALLELDLDFAEEGVELIPPAEVDRRLQTAAEHVRQLASTYEEGRLYREGVTVVFAGKPNVGKSSLFNALLKEERAIVTPAPGTTRDFIEESVSLDGMLFRLVDTAGIRESLDVAEREGVVRARNAVGNADIVVLVVDATEEIPITAALSELNPRPVGQRVLVALNKIDLLKGEFPACAGWDRLESDFTAVRLSALTGEGVHELHKTLVGLVSSGVTHDEHDVIITNRRHTESLRSAATALDRARSSLAKGTTSEFIALDLREAASALAEITGEVTSEEILNAIFSRFCIGK